MKIIFIGTQGSGKSTQAKMLAQVVGFPYIEMGQLLRDKSKGLDTEAGEIREALKVGDLVHDKITVKTLQERIAKSDCNNGFVLDGYPRNYAQLEGLPSGIDRVFFIAIPDQEAIRRLVSRGRADDSLDVITRRLENFHRQSEPLLTYFRQQGILEEIDGLRTIQGIHGGVLERIKAKNNGQN